MARRNNKILIVFFVIIAILIIWKLFDKPKKQSPSSSNSSSSSSSRTQTELPLNLGMEHFTPTKSRFGRFGDVTLYPNGTPIPENIKISLPNVRIIMEYNLGEFVDTYRIPTDPGVAKSNAAVCREEIFDKMLILPAITQDRVTSFLKRLPSDMYVYVCCMAFWGTFVLGTDLKSIIKYCVDNNVTITDDFWVGIYPAYCYVVNYLLNIDLINDIPLINDGWDEFEVADAELTSPGSQSILLVQNIDSSKKIKCIAMIFQGSDADDGNMSTVVMNVTLKDDSISTTEIPVCINTDPTNLNYNFMIPRLNYAVNVRKIEIIVNGESSLVRFRRGKLCVVYCSTDCPNITGDSSTVACPAF